jgi:isopenicillin N synthase-like dioxygenase
MGPNTEYPWAIAALEAGQLRFETSDGLERALHDGFFFVLKPQALSLEAGDCFATNFYLPRQGDRLDTYRDFLDWTAARLADHEGYFVRDVDQVEQFFLESRFWPQVFPPALTVQASELRAFAVNVLHAVLLQLDLPAAILDKATGYALSGRGTYHLTFNHFRPHVRARGLNVHKDSGWITLLRSLEPGLEIRRGQEWLPIKPRPDAFIMNFGCAMEILTRATRTPVAAVAHRVCEQQLGFLGEPDRFSYGLFVDSSLDTTLCEGLYRYDANAGLVLETDFKTFLDKILHNTYDQNTEGLY